MCSNCGLCGELVGACTELEISLKQVEGDVVTLEIPDPIIQKFSQRQEFKTLLDQFLEPSLAESQG